MTDYKGVAGGDSGLSVQLYKSATQSVPDDEAYDRVLWQLVEWDTDGSAADTANDRIVMTPSWDGTTVLVTGVVGFTGTSGSGVYMNIRHYDSGDVQIGNHVKIDSNHGGNDGRYDISRQIRVADGDYFEFWFALDTGISGSRTLLAGSNETTFTVTRI